jgi:hypothetical protein
MEASFFVRMAMACIFLVVAHSLINARACFNR